MQEMLLNVDFFISAIFYLFHQSVQKFSLQIICNNTEIFPVIMLTGKSNGIIYVGWLLLCKYMHRHKDKIKNLFFYISKFSIF